jgi:hypothetical protein
MASAPSSPRLVSYSCGNQKIAKSNAMQARESTFLAQSTPISSPTSSMRSALAHTAPCSTPSR